MISTDILLDRIALKRQVKRWKTLTIIALLACFLIPIMVMNEDSYTAYIARVTIEGAIDQSLEREDKLRDLATDDHAKAVIVHINSPGGTFVGSEGLCKALREIAKHKPVVAVMGNMATSGGYMAAVGADYIFASNGTVTGSIAVLLEKYEVYELAKKLGVNVVQLTAGKYKAMTSPFEALSEEKRQFLLAHLRETHSHFIRLIAERRKLPIATLSPLADGRVFTGAEALHHKLIDGIGGHEEARQWLHEKKQISLEIPVRSLTLEKKVPFYEEWLSTFVPHFTPHASHRLSGILALWLP